MELITLGAFSLSGLIMAFVMVFLLFVVKDQFTDKKLRNRWYFLHILLLLWGISSFFIGISKEVNIASFHWHWSMVGVCFLPFAFAQVCSAFINKEPPLLVKAFMLFISISFAIIHQIRSIVDVVYMKPLFYLKVVSFYPLYIALLCGWLCIVLYSIILLYKGIKEGLSINRLRFAFFSAYISTAYITGFTNFFPVIGIPLYPYGNYGIVIYLIGAMFTELLIRYRESLKIDMDRINDLTKIDTHYKKINKKYQGMSQRLETITSDIEKHKESK